VIRIEKFIWEFDLCLCTITHTALHQDADRPLVCQRYVANWDDHYQLTERTKGSKKEGTKSK